LKRAFSELSKTAAGRCRITTTIVQSLNSPFFPPHIGAEPGRAKEESRESRITLLSPARVEPLYGVGTEKGEFRDWTTTTTKRVDFFSDEAWERELDTRKQPKTDYCLQELEVTDYLSYSSYLRVDFLVFKALYFLFCVFLLHCSMGFSQATWLDTLVNLSLI